MVDRRTYSSQTFTSNMQDWGDMFTSTLPGAWQIGWLVYLTGFLRSKKHPGGYMQVGWHGTSKTNAFQPVLAIHFECHIYIEPQVYSGLIDGHNLVKLSFRICKAQGICLRWFFLALSYCTTSLLMRLKYPQQGLQRRKKLGKLNKAEEKAHHAKFFHLSSDLL